MSRPAAEPNRCGEDADFRQVKTGFPSNRYAAAAVCGLLLLAVALVFGQTVRHGFIIYDDLQYVCENPQVARGFTAPGIAWAFTHFHASNWHPLTWLSHTLDCQLYGLGHPGGHHLTNVLLHAASAILLFLVLRQMTGDQWPSAFAAVLFAIHPLHVESVAWVAERKDVLSGLFFMLTLAAYTGYARRPFSLLRYLLATVLFALGLMAKPILVTLPLVLLLLDYWPLGRMQGAGGTEHRTYGTDMSYGSHKSCPGSAMPRPWVHGARPTREPQAGAPPRSWLPLVAEKIPLFALAAVSCVVTYCAQRVALSPSQHLALFPRIANALVSCVAYLGQFFYPVGLAVFYPYPQNGVPIWKVAAAGLLLTGISLAVLACGRKCPYLPVGWLWYLGMLVPVIGLVQVGFQAMADRYTYLTQIGLYIALAWGGEHVSRRWPYRRCLGGAVAAIVVAALAWCAWRQVSYWKDDETLWPYTLACTSRNWLAHNSLAGILAVRGHPEEAMVEYRKSLEIKPDNAQAHNNLGAVLAGRGRVDEAIVHYRKSLEIKSDYAKAHFNLGNALAAEGKLEEALQHYQESLRLQPDQPEVLKNAESVQAEIRRHAAGTSMHESPSSPAKTSAGR